jgi:hypothetical protein
LSWTDRNYNRNAYMSMKWKNNHFKWECQHEAYFINMEMTNYEELITNSLNLFFLSVTIRLSFSHSGVNVIVTWRIILFWLFLQCWVLISGPVSVSQALYLFWVTSSALFCFSYFFQKGSHIFCPGSALDCDLHA